MAKYLPIEVDKIPYSFNVELSNKIYTITLKYNDYSDEFTMDLKLGGEILVKGKKMLIGEPIFEEFSKDLNGNKNPKFFDELLVPYDLSWEENVITLDNLNKKVFVYVFDGDNNDV